MSIVFESSPSLDIFEIDPSSGVVEGWGQGGWGVTPWGGGIGAGEAVFSSDAFLALFTSAAALPTLGQSASLVSQSSSPSLAVFD